jgi:hypothetical protein
MRPGLALPVAAAAPRGQAAKPAAPMALAVIVSARRRDTMIAFRSELSTGDPCSNHYVWHD